MKDLAVAYAVRKRNAKSIKGKIEPVAHDKRTLDNEDVDAMVNAMMEKKKPALAGQITETVPEEGDTIEELDFSEEPGSLFSDDAPEPPEPDEATLKKEKLSEIMAEIRSRR